MKQAQQVELIIVFLCCAITKMDYFDFEPSMNQRFASINQQETMAGNR